jgi:hypothetical protein
MNRLTITLDDDLYAMARAYAAANRKSISKAIGDLLRRGGVAGRTAQGSAGTPENPGFVHVVSGFPFVDGAGCRIDSEDVRRAEDDEDIRHLEMMGLSGEEIERGLAR